MVFLCRVHALSLCVHVFALWPGADVVWLHAGLTSHVCGCCWLTFMTMSAEKTN